MAQTTLTSFFTSRKRPASDDIIGSKSKVPHLDRCVETGTKGNCAKFIVKNPEIVQDVKQTVSEICEHKNKLDSGIDHTSSNEHFQIPLETGIFAKKSNITNIIKPLEASKNETISTARKELSLGEIKKRLAGSSRLAELKASAERISKNIQQYKEARENKGLKEFKSIDLEVQSSPSKKTLLQNDLETSMESPVTPQQRPLISPRKVIVSPIKSPSKVPAYIKYAALATSSTTLPLPHHYRFLAELFRGMETVVALLHNRNEKITFTKLKPSVQEMLKRNFTEKHLAQIKHLVPDFYNYEVQKVKNISTSCQKDVYELVISPNFPNDIKAMNPSVLLERRRYFYDTLLQLMKKHHAQFILTLDPPMVIPDNKLSRWHPEFEIEKTPEVESAKLPEVPNSEKFSTAQDVLARARDLFKCNTKMSRALEKLAQAKARGLTEQEKAATGITGKEPNKMTIATQTSTGALINPALRNLPAALLEKVKAKQAAKALEAMTRSSDYDQKYIIYSRLPDLARTLRNIFVTERKNVLALNIILSKLDSSFKSNVSANDLQRDMKLLAEEVPDWIKIHEIRSNSYIKLDKSADLKSIITKLEDLSAKYKND